MRTATPGYQALVPDPVPLPPPSRMSSTPMDEPLACSGDHHVFPGAGAIPVPLPAPAAGPTSFPTSCLPGSPTPWLSPLDGGHRIVDARTRTMDCGHLEIWSIRLGHQRHGLCLAAGVNDPQGGEEIANKHAADSRLCQGQTNGPQFY